MSILARRFVETLAIVGLIVMGACAADAAATAAKPAARADWKAEWDKVVAAAKKEGKVAVAGPPGEAYRDALTAFQKAYPNVKVEYFGSTGSKFAPRALAERRSGQYLWDVHIGGTTTMLTSLRPEGALALLRPALIVPEVLDDGSWILGFDDGYADIEKKLIYSFIAVNNWTAYINRQAVPEDALKTLDDILNDPRWKGKIAMHDPRPAGSGSRMLGTLLHTRGEEAVKRLLVDQEPAITEDNRQLVEWLVRGRYPIALAVSSDQFVVFQQAGMNLDHVKPLTGSDPGLSGVNNGFGSVVLMSNAPHPNAAKVYINWLLSREAQVIFSQQTLYNSRRTDVQVVAPDRAFDPKGKYINLNKEEYGAVRARAQELAKKYIK